MADDGAVQARSPPASAGPVQDAPDEELEEEPRLKYKRLGSSVPELLGKDAASCLCVSDKILVLGTHDGTLHILDFDGNEVRRMAAHKSTVNDISFDEAVEFIASCSDDGTVVVQGFYTDEMSKYHYRRPVKTVALDPRYGARKTREFVSGGLAGQLTLNSRGWLGSKDAVLAAGEGAVQVARWAGTLVAWADDAGVRVYDTAVHQHSAFLDRPRSALRPGAPGCRLFWQGEERLYVAWGDAVRVGAVAAAPRGGGAGGGEPRRALEVVATLQMDCLVAGIAPFGGDIAVLAYVPAAPAADAAADANGGGRAPAPEAHRPEVRSSMRSDAG